MKKIETIYILLFSACSTSLYSQNRESVLIAPDQWNSEQIAFPLAFAPGIQLEGFEDIRFAPGWSDPRSKEFWTYHFTWVLEQPVELDEDYLESTLSIYFDGLAQTILGQLPDTSVMEEPAKAISQFHKTENGFTGTIRIFDAFHTMEIINLNIKVRERKCTASGKQLISFDLSPKPFDNQIWNIFNNIQVICQ